MLDRPGGHKRHGAAVPYLGGLAIIVAFSAAVLAATLIHDPSSLRVGELAAILGLAVGLALFGLADDLRGLGATVRLAAQTAAGVALWLLGSGVASIGPDPVDLLVTVVWVVGVTNASTWWTTWTGSRRGSQPPGRGSSARIWRTFSSTAGTRSSCWTTCRPVARAGAVFHLAAAVGVELIVSEPLAHTYWRDKGLPTVITRLFNTVGPRETGTYGMGIPRFVNQAIHGEALTVYGDGTQTRCFCYVGDVVAALVALLEHTEARGDVFNLGGSEEVSIEQRAKRVISVTDSTSPIRYVPYDEAYERGFEDMPRRVPDTSKAHRLIGFEPTVSLNEIIAMVVEEQRS